MATTDDLELLVRARYPILYVVTSEETRVMEALDGIAGRRQKRLFDWSCTGGLVPYGTNIQSRQRNSATKDPLVALEQVLEQIEPAIFVFRDLHPWLGRENTTVIRRLKDIALHLKNSLKTIVIVSPVLEVPVEMEKEVTVVPFPLPGRDEMRSLIEGIESELAGLGHSRMTLDAAGRQTLVDACLGLTRAEAENVFARLLVRHERVGADLVDEVLLEKQQIIRKSGLLEYLPPGPGLPGVGGMAGLKRWVTDRACAFTEEARQFGLPPPRGLLLLGVQGCGKSLCAKAVASEWHLPLLRFDLGRMFGSYVGASEENVRRAIAVAESVAPAVLWIDEIDKAFAGTSGSSGGDSGVASRVFATLLTWLAEKTSPVFVVATANQIEHLPPELLRKGRFDELFFVDLPAAGERAEILAVHLAARGRDPGAFELIRHARAAEGFSGAELEQAIISGLFRAFRLKRDLLDEDIEAALSETVPLARTLSEAIERLRRWAEGRARPAASAAD